jgi:hypothetical protein
MDEAPHVIEETTPVPRDAHGFSSSSKSRLAQKRSWGSLFSMLTATTVLATQHRENATRRTPSAPERRLGDTVRLGPRTDRSDCSEAPDGCRGRARLLRSLEHL